MLDINDRMLTDLQPSMEWDDWIKDLKKVVDNSNYYSDEISESDDEKGNVFYCLWLLMFYQLNINHFLFQYKKKELRKFIQQKMKIQIMSYMCMTRSGDRKE